MTLRFGVLLLQDRRLDELTSWARRYDEAGADSVWVADHLSNPHALDRPWLDSWLTLGEIAHATTTCRIGPLVTNFVLHSPLDLARKAHTLNVMSGNRLDLGIGAGGAPVDRSFAGVDDSSMSALIARLNEGLDIFGRAMNSERISVTPVPVIAGRPVAADVAVSFAEGAPTRPPIVIGGQGKGSIDTAARYADRWNAYLPGPWGTSMSEAMRAANAYLDERCAAYGREPRAVGRSLLLDLTSETAADSPSQLADVVHSMSQLGFTEFIAYAWAGAAVRRSPDDLLTFVTDHWPALRDAV